MLVILFLFQLHYSNHFCFLLDESILDIVLRYPQFHQSML